MKKLWLFLSLLICSTLVAGCGNNKQALPENPIIFSETEIDWHWAIENDWKYYFAYSTIKPKWVIWDFNYAFWDCLWYVWDDSNDRIYELSGESSDEWLIKYYVNGEMETPTILREITIKDEKYIPESVEGAPEEDVRFPDSNPIYWWIWTHEIVWDKTIYYNDEYGISFRLWEEFSWGRIVERDTEEWDTINENLYKLHRIEVYKKDWWWEWYGQVFIINAVNNEQFNIWKWRPIYNENLENDVLWTNNKYSFWSKHLHNNWIVDITNERVTDMYIFDINSPEVIPWKGEENILTIEKENMNTNNIINLKIWNAAFDVTLEGNSATKALIEKLHEWDIVVNAREYWWFEKVGNLGFDLPRADEQITTEPGDIVLYQWNQVSLFYNSNSRSYTKLWKVQMNSEEYLEKILWNWDVTLTFSLK